MLVAHVTSIYVQCIITARGNTSLTLQTRSEYYSLYRAAQEASGVSFVPESPLIYDSVWTLALALNATIANQIPASNSCSSGLPLEDFSYSSANLGSEIREAVSRTSFSGASVSLYQSTTICNHGDKSLSNSYLIIKKLRYYPGCCCV